MDPKENALIFQILGVVLVLFFCFLTYMNTRVWRVTHVMFAFLTFSATIGFLVYAALTIKTHTIWKARAQQLDTRLEQEKTKTYQMRVGDPGNYPQKIRNIHQVGQEVARAVIDRGRVWRGCTVTGGDANGMILSTAPADAPQGQVPRPNHIQPKATFHAFKEILVPTLGAKVPRIYLGQFHASQATDTTVTLVPVFALDAQQQKDLNDDAAATWVLYETMPVDDQNVFRGLTEEELKQLMPIERTALTAEEYTAFIQSFARSGTKYQDSDPPEYKWALVKFNKAHKVQVDGPTPGVMVTQRNAFDLQGQAILPRLQRGKEKGEAVEFDIGDEALFYFDDETVRALIADNTVTVQDYIFVRPLADFEFVMGHTFQKIQANDDRMKEITRDLAAVNASNANILKQIASKDAEKLKLEEDLKFIKYEQAQLTVYADQLGTQVRAMNTRLSELYRTNVGLEKELNAINARLTEEIDKKTDEATTAVAGG